ncbi:neuropeptide S receptor [Biomphalaria pfeifferi]|uniref:Neuropeptide S receptor n=1 Tax=Biomphalaria pfeifferi TaxID=112525 RepID=A0AAD8EUX4_BIOPF|nr:neuropeptide S receptor [Biomphalaria pfeifferi]
MNSSYNMCDYSTVLQFQHHSALSSMLALVNVSNNMSDHLTILTLLQNQSTLTFIPAMVFLALLSVVGIIGNSLVLFVYWRKFSRTAMGVLIMEIAVYDLLTNTVVIPGEIYDMFHQWNFEFAALCKVRKLFNVTTTLASAITLVAIGVTRYKRICQPLRKQVTITQVYVGTTFILFVSLTSSFPFALLHGRRTRNTSVSGVMGYSCDVDDAYAGSIWPMVNSIFFVTVYALGSGMIVVLYGMIWSKAWRHRTSMTRNMSRSASDSNLLRKLSAEGSCSVSSSNRRRNKRLSRSLQALNRELCQREDTSNLYTPETVDQSTSCATLHIDLASDSTQCIETEAHNRSAEKTRKASDVFTNLLINIRRRYSETTYRKENTLETSRCHFRRETSSANSTLVSLKPSQKLNTSVSRENSMSEIHALNNLDVSFQIQRISLSNRRFLVKPKRVHGRASERFSSHSVRRKRQRNFGRTSCMLLTISVVFILSYLPFTSLQAFKNIAPEMYQELEGTGLALFHLFYRSYLVNSASNAVIYSLCDLRFRQETIKLFKKS